MNTIPSFLDSITLDAAKANINYVKARCAIESAFPKRADCRAAKMAVIEALGGTVVHPEELIPNKPHRAHNYVLFPDHSKAAF